MIADGAVQVLEEAAGGIDPGTESGVGEVDVKGQVKDVTTTKSSHCEPPFKQLLNGDYRLKIHHYAKMLSVFYEDW